MEDKGLSESAAQKRIDKLVRELCPTVTEFALREWGRILPMNQENKKPQSRG